MSFRSPTATSSISMPSVRNKMPKTRVTPRQPEAAMTTSKQVEVLSRPSNTRLDEVYARPEVRLDWENQVPLHVAKQVVRLRRFRRMSQAKVAAAMGTSQSAIARIESAQENITLDTLERLIRALKGRFYVSIAPEELPARRPADWWDTIDQWTTPWTLVGVVWRRTDCSDQVIVGLERAFADVTDPTMIDETLPVSDELLVGEAEAS